LAMLAETVDERRLMPSRVPFPGNADWMFGIVQRCSSVVARTAAPATSAVKESGN
jgi:hypothetical protein